MVAGISVFIHDFESMPFYAQDIKAARNHLRKNDEVMKAIIRAVGPFTAKARRDRFDTLVRSVLSQQISVAAAQTIRGRLQEAVGEAGITPVSLLKFEVDELRELGISRQKATYVLDLADSVDSGAVNLQLIHKKTDEEVIQELIQVKGIGVWTAQMFLMFSLARMDIFPVDDLGIKNAIKRSYGLGEVPDRSTMEQLAQNWRPYATVASWYLWQSLEV